MKTIFLFTIAVATVMCGGTTNTFLAVPLCRQAKSFTCGVAAMQSVLGYYGVEIRQDLLEKKLRTNRGGTHYQHIIAYAQSQGFTTEWQTNMSYAQLQQTLDTGMPVIVALQAWAETNETHQVPGYSNDWVDGHYAVAIGYDETNTYFMDPSTLGHYTFIPTSEFMDRWHDKAQKTSLIHMGIVVTTNGPRYDPAVRTKME